MTNWFVSVASESWANTDDSYLVGVILEPGSESIIPDTLNMSNTSVTQQKMKQLVPYMMLTEILTTESLDVMLSSVNFLENIKKLETFNIPSPCMS